MSLIVKPLSVSPAPSKGETDVSFVIGKCSFLPSFYSPKFYDAVVNTPQQILQRL